MGIDVYLSWPGMTASDKQNQVTGFATTEGHVGYLREAYHGGPYATKILVREAFESETCEAQIPAAVMRQRLSQVTEPARGCDGGHVMAAAFAAALREKAAEDKEKHVVGSATLANGGTTPMSVEEAIYLRCAALYPENGKEYAQQVVKSFRNFVALAEEKEAATGQPCTVYASY